LAATFKGNKHDAEGALGGADQLIDPDLGAALPVDDAFVLRDLFFDLPGLFELPGLFGNFSHVLEPKELIGKGRIAQKRLVCAPGVFE
jgi:hypothetical protein